ncbi:hypothetical protein RB2150_05548 [Rhodobacterales bacterium HTCC2150]|nr:hypothetical protein RB2150_05548 [Rhodobacterales bacterium HTCC2150] [Rhodobacteraceae bacterium HTCC2150]
MVPASNIIQNFESERRLFDPLVAVFVLGCIGVGVAAMPMWSPIGEINLYCFSYLSTAIIVWTLTYLVADIVGENLLRGVTYTKRSLIMQMVLAPVLTLTQIGIFALFFDIAWTIPEYIRFFAANFSIAMILRATEHITFRATTKDPAIQRSPFLLRLRQRGRSRLIRISASDHYLDVYSDQGHEMVRMRLADAIKELSGYPGLQVHRSHWIATRKVQKKVARDGKTFLVMQDGYEVPVSSSFAEKLAKRRSG